MSGLSKKKPPVASGLPRNLIFHADPKIPTQARFLQAMDDARAFFCWTLGSIDADFSRQFFEDNFSKTPGEYRGRFSWARPPDFLAALVNYLNVLLSCAIEN